ncbi:ROK family protein, partial [Streptomyces sp. TRM76130]|nr:ROK family protein [Streptomyces sp. TRM76130]
VEGLFAQSLLSLSPAHRPLPVSSDNEANAAALAELWFGAGTEGVRSFLYLTGEIGIGGALVLRGELLRGAHGFAGEIGHMVVDPDGPLCRCGARGCLEQYAGQGALLTAAGIDADTGVRGVAELGRRARRGETAACSAIERAGRRLGVVVSGAVNLFDPEAVMLGGVYRELSDWLAPAVDR